MESERGTWGGFWETESQREKERAGLCETESERGTYVALWETETERLGDGEDSGKRGQRKGNGGFWDIDSQILGFWEMEQE